MPKENETSYRFRVDAGLFFSVRALSKEAAKKVAAEVVEDAKDGYMAWAEVPGANDFQVYSNDDAKATMEDEEEIT